MKLTQTWRWKKTDPDTGAVTFGTHTHQATWGDVGHENETEAEFKTRFASECAALEIEFPPTKEQP
jgi:hypothetical protein